LLDVFPDADLEVFVAWTQVLADDAFPAAVHSAEVFDDPRVHQFYDERLLGRAVAGLVGLPPSEQLIEALGGDREALAEHFQPDYLAGDPSVFDTVFFFDREATWTEDDGVPAPRTWVTQLNPSMFVGIDFARFHWDAAFHAELRRIGTEIWGPR
jgi:hypothetical protein